MPLHHQLWTVGKSPSLVATDALSINR